LEFRAGCTASKKPSHNEWSEIANLLSNNSRYSGKGLLSSLEDQITATARYPVIIIRGRSGHGGVPPASSRRTRDHGHGCIRLRNPKAVGLRQEQKKSPPRALRAGAQYPKHPPQTGHGADIAGESSSGNGAMRKLRAGTSSGVVRDEGVRIAAPPLISSTTCLVVFTLNLIA
jgi:hypothetical protein